MYSGQLNYDVLSVPGLLRAIRRHRGRALVALTICVMLTVLLIVVRKREYQSSAKLFVRIGRETASVDPTAQASGQLIHVTDTQEREIRSLVSVLSNRDLYEKAVDEIGANTILNFPGDGELEEPSRISQMLGRVKGGIKSALVAMRLIEPVSEREQAIGVIRDSLTIEAGDSTSVVRVSAQASSPHLAQRIVTKLIDLHLAFHLHSYSTPGSMSFFSSQTDRLSQQLEQATLALAALKNQNQIASIESKKESLEARMLSLEENRFKATAALAAASSRIAAFAEQLNREAKLVASVETTGMAGSAKSAMREELYRLQIVESELLAKLKPTHPRVAEIRDQIEKAREVFDQEDQQVQVTSSLSEIHQQLRINLLIEQAKRVALEAEIKSLDTAREQLVDEISQINDGELQLANLQRRVDMLDTKYRRYVESLEQVRINQELESNRISNINVVQRPSLVEVPIGVSNLVVLCAGLIAALCVACGVAMLSELVAQPQAWLRPGESAYAAFGREAGAMPAEADTTLPERAMESVEA